MSQPTTPNVEGIFLAALEIEEPEARSSYLDRVCGDAELRRHVERLLALDALASGFLESPASPPTLTVESERLPEGLGTVIGPYKLMEPIGEGGMGVVYVAEQTRPVRRRVALKIIKPGMDTKQVVDRFEAERQALAMMDHPNIARVIDGGVSPPYEGGDGGVNGGGRPYFVMELVRGIPITDYCDRERLSIRERLELFVQVCRAVQHAHQKGIIHRDLKPSNILVTVIDGAAVPKVIDFGVAKATGGQLTERTVYTAFHQFVGTPLYMSPEQAEFSGVDVDTRSDIYSLGVLLYELLTGTTPFDQRTFRTAAFDEIRRIIREQEPPRPSTRISTLEATATTISTNRRTEPSRLRRSLRGELDWIVMKALEKDRRRRYETANAFAADMMRYLTDQPVEACPPSAWYRFGKLARRNRVALTTAVLLGLVLVAGTAVSAWQAVRATRAERESGRQSRLALAAAEAVRDREINLRHQAEEFAEQSRRRQARLSVDQGMRLVETGDLTRALPWFVEALRLDDDDPARAAIHRIRLTTTLAQCVKPAQIWVSDQPLGYGEFRPDGRAVSIPSWDGTVTVRDIATGEALGPTLRHTDRVWTARFGPDGRRLVTASFDGTARIWDVSSGREVLPPLKHEGRVLEAVFSPDGSRIVTSSAPPPFVHHHSCCLWGAATGQAVTPPFVAGLPAFSPDSRFLATENTADGSQPVMRLYHARTGQPVQPSLEQELDGVSIHPRSFSPDGRRLVTAHRDKVRIWDTTTGRLLIPPLNLTAIPTRASFSPDGRWIVTGAEDGTVQIWDAVTGALRIPSLRHEGRVRTATFSPDSTRVLIGGADGTVRVWDAATGRSVAPSIEHQGAVLDATFDSDSRYVLSFGIDRTVRLWDLATACSGRITLPHASAVYEAAFNPDGRILATTGRDGTALWDLTTGKPVGPPLDTSGEISPDGRLLLTWRELDKGRLYEATIWDLATRKAVGVPMRHQISTGTNAGRDSLKAVWSKDSRRVATAMAGFKWASLSLGSSQVRVWEVETGAPVTPVLTMDALIQALEFSPDGELLATASGNGWELVQAGDVRLLDAGTGLSRIPPIHTPYTCRMVRFSPDGRRLVTASGGDWGTNGEAQVWEVSNGKPVTIPLQHTGMVASASYSPDGRLVLTASADGTAQIWDANTGERVLPPLQHRYPVHSATFSPDSRFVLTTSSPTDWLAENRAYAQVWDATTGQPVTPPFWHTRAITSAVFSPDSRLVATTSYGDGAQVWTLAPDPRPLDDWLKLTELLSGAKVDASGGMRPIDRSELRERSQALRTKDPSVFTASHDQVLGWHDQEALACETAGAWEPALGHLNILIATRPGVDALRLRRAKVHAELDHWREAVEDYRGVVRSEHASFYDWYSLTLLELGNGDRDRYRDACAGMLRRFGQGGDIGEITRFTAWACALGPAALDDFNPVLALAERVHSARPQDKMAAEPLGALLFRAGRFEEAIRRLTETDKLAGDTRTSPIYTWFFLALAHQRLGHDHEARTWRDKALAATEHALAGHAKGTGDPVAWNRRLTLRLLRKEVETQIPNTSRLESRPLHREAADLFGPVDLPDDVFARP